MKNILLKPGDFFCVRGEGLLSKAIIVVEKAQAKDNQARYSHTGIIVNESGATVEALDTITYNDINHYIGNEVILMRWSGMNPEAFKLGMSAIAENINRKYPWWRIALDFFGLGKVRTGGDAVCSEIFAKFAIAAGFKEIGEWCGQNPDDIADLKKWKNVEVIFEGVWRS